MAYSAFTALRKEVPFKNSTLISDADLTAVITEADSIIDSYIVEAYTLPLSETPNIILSLSKDISRILMYRDQNLNIEIAQGFNWKDEWVELMLTLDNIRTRKQKLLDSNGDELTLQDRVSPQFYPTDASEEDEDDPTASKFTMNKVY